MFQKSQLLAALAASAVSFGAMAIAIADEIIKPASQRFAPKDVSETPNFQQHVVPLLSRLGCNGRACHGSFQGQGGFRLSLFGYDFKLDHEGLTKGDKEKDKEPRVLTDEVEDSLALLKATQEMPHRGGKRMDVDSWQYNIFRNWIKAGAKNVEADSPKFVKLEVTPSEIQFDKNGETSQLNAIAVWSDGTREDVTPLCRFNTNDEVIASIDANGLVKAGETGDTHVVVNYDAGVVPIPVIRPVSDKTGDKYPNVETPTKIDELIVLKLRKLGVVPSGLCDDAEFLRRASLDITGTLPAPQEITEFLSNQNTDKRAKKIDELLERPGYAAWWATKLSDFTGNNAAMLNRGNVVKGAAASQAWYDWLFTRVANNTPYDQLVAGIVAGKSRKEGESYEDYCQRMSGYFATKGAGNYSEHPSLDFFWARQNFGKSEDRVIGFAYTFMGIRIQCAQCHKHPFDQWTQDDFNQFKEFFNGTTVKTRPQDKSKYEAMLTSLGVDKNLKGNDLQKVLPKEMNSGKVVPFEELVVIKPQAPKNNNKERPKDKDNGKGAARRPAGPTARLLGGETIYLTEHDDPRSPLMSWLRDKNNRFFARAFVNRVWSNYFNVGIVNPSDDMSLANAPSNAPLLDYLAAEFVEHNFDMKWLHREICNSATYQRSWKPNETNKLDEKNFSHAIPHRLPAEVAVDIVKQATLSDAEFVKFQNELKGRAIFNAVPIQRGGGNGKDGAFALTVFGRSTRESNCDCDRSMEASLLQTVYMQNDDEVAKALNDSKGWAQSLFPKKTPLKTEDNKLGRDSEVTAKARSVRRNFEKLIENNERLLKKARKANNESEIKELEARNTELKGKIAKLQESVVAKTDEAKAKNAKKTETQPDSVTQPGVVFPEPELLIKAAYLRSLSRLPTDDETAASKKYLAQSEDPVTGARDLLWALINTKEFVLNH